jgi:hypothetical protein
MANAFIQDVMHDADLLSDPNAYPVMDEDVAQPSPPLHEHAVD